MSNEYHIINADITDLIQKMEEQVVDKETTEAEKAYMMGLESKQLPSNMQQQPQFYTI